MCLCAFLVLCQKGCTVAIVESIIINREDGMSKFFRNFSFKDFDCSGYLADGLYVTADLTASKQCYCSPNRHVKKVPAKTISPGSAS